MFWGSFSYYEKGPCIFGKMNKREGSSKEGLKGEERFDRART
jgi:hypothetical protein